MAFQKKINLTIDSTYIDEDLTDFPVMIRISPSAGRSSQDITDIFSELGDSQYKFKIEDSDNNQLYTEIDYWSNTEQRANLWVKVPSISSITDTIISLYYDISEDDNTTYVGEVGSQPASGVWDSNFIAVWHFSQQTSAGLLDSTGSPQHDSHTQVNFDSDERINDFTGHKIVFNGTDEYFNVGNRQVKFQLQKITLEALFDNKVDAAERTIFHHGNTAQAGHRGFWFQYSPAEQMFFNCWDGAWAQYVSTNFAASGSNTWGTWTVSGAGAWSNPVKNWQEATQLTMDDSSALGTISQPNLTTAGAYLGMLYQGTPTQRWVGGLSELRISDIVRSDSWIHASKNSIRDTLITYSELIGVGFDVARPQVKAATSPLGWKESDIYVKHKGVLRPVQQILLRKNNEWKIMNDITPPIVRKTPPFGPVDLTDGFVDVSPSDNPYSPTADVLTWNHDACNTETYYYKDFGVDFFNDFQIDFEMEYTVVGANTSQVGSVTVAEQLGSNANQLGIGGLVHAGSRTQIHMQKFGVTSAMLRDMGSAVPLPNWYYRIERVGTNFTYSVWYTDATRMDTPDLTNTEDWGTTSYRYLIVAAAMGTNQAAGGEGTVSNIVININ